MFTVFYNFFILVTKGLTEVITGKYVFGGELVDNVTTIKACLERCLTQTRYFDDSSCGGIVFDYNKKTPLYLQRIKCTVKPAPLIKSKITCPYNKLFPKFTGFLFIAKILL